MHTSAPGTTSRPPSRRGAFVTFEGVDGVGKTTQCTLLCRSLEQAGFEVVRLREPGGTAVGERVRSLVLDPRLQNVDPLCELLLYEAARAQLVAEVVRPALARGAVVVSDRFFDSTVAYQGFGRELGYETVARANQTACAGVTPDRTVLLDLDPSRAWDRATAAGQDRMELEGPRFQERVRTGFLEVARREPDRVRTVDAGGDVYQVWGRVRACLADLFGELPAYPFDGEERRD